MTAAVSVDELLRTSVERGASDLHLTVGLPPQLRVDGLLSPLPLPPLTAEGTASLARQLLNDAQWQAFERAKEIDTSYSIRGLSRFRVNLYYQRGSVAAALRRIPYEIPSLSELRLPELLGRFAERMSGLFIVSGPTGCGKSTTLASMVDHINETRNCHIVSIEDPIEYLHRHKKATVNQREIGSDTYSFREALRHVVREDPNVILIGEMRDLETMSAALTLAETGHLILTTLHTSDAIHAVHRIVDVFPPYQQDQIRVQLSLVLIGITVQQLIPSASGRGRVPACEILTCPPAVGNLIRETELHQLRSVMQTSRNLGMCTMNQALADLFARGEVTWEEISRRSTDPGDLATLVQQTHAGKKR